MRLIAALLIAAALAVAQIPKPTGSGGLGGGSGTVTEVTGGTGIAVVNGTTTPTISVDTAIVPFYETTAGAPASSCSAGQRIALDATADQLYYCSDTNTWSPVLIVASTAVTNTGTSTTTAVTPDGLAGSTFGEVVMQALVTADFSTATATGDGKFYIVVPQKANGMNLVNARAQVITAGTTNTTDVQIARCAVTASGNACSGTVSDMLSTKITIDSGENSSDSAATAAVINTSNDDVATGQIIRVDVDAISSTPAQGLMVILTFRLP